MAGRTAGPIKTKLGIGTYVDPGSVLVKVIWRHLANANKTPYRGAQGPRELEHEALRVPQGPREFAIVSSSWRMGTYSKYIISVSSGQISSVCSSIPDIMELHSSERNAGALN